MSSTTPQTSELLVINSSDVSALENAISNLLHTADRIDSGEYIVQEEFFSALKKVEAIRSQTKPVLQCLRHVEASGEDAEDPILAVLPPGMPTAQASDLINQAVIRAQALSADGEGAPYFEALQESLACGGIEITGSIENMESGPWDISHVIPPEPHDQDLMDDDPEWVRVTVSGPAFQDSDTDWEMRLEDKSAVEFVEGDQPFIGFVRSLTYNFPRSDRYGVPEAATDSGARQFIVDELGFACSRDLVVYGCDSRDDTPANFYAECIMPRDVLRVVDAPIERPGE
jgi:hypothetical protein